MGRIPSEGKPRMEEIQKDKRRKYLKEYYRKNRKKLLKKQKLYYQNNKEKIKNKALKWNREHKEIHYSRIKRWQKENKQRIYYKRNIRRNFRRKVDINFRIQELLRNRLNTIIKNNQKVGSAVKDLGCSVEKLKQYLESKFELGMTWKNYGLYGWHIDHVIPLSKFNLSKRNQFLKACHYTNLQPLWAKDNLKKGNRSNA